MSFISSLAISRCDSYGTTAPPPSTTQRDTDKARPSSFARPRDSSPVIRPPARALSPAAATYCGASTWLPSVALCCAACVLLAAAAPAMSAPSQHQRWARGQGRRAQATARGRIGSRRHPQTQRQNGRGTAHVPFRGKRHRTATHPGGDRHYHHHVDWCQGLAACLCRGSAIVLSRHVAQPNTPPHRWSAQCHRTRPMG